MVTASPEEETDRAAELAAVADELGALFEEYRDVFPDLPISPETFRLHVRQLKEANDEARQAEEEATELSAKLTEARQRLDASLSESARLDKKPTKPN
jgi:predicted transcriptional regulator